MNSPPLFRLALLGPPSLTSAAGDSLTGPPIQRHRIALLAQLARAPGAGIARDVVSAQLWPESDRAHSRNLLNVSLHVLRRTLGEGAILSEGQALRLGVDRVEVDVRLFEAALGRGELEGAVSLYVGPFMDGFFLKDAPEFGYWVDRERARLADQYVAALRELADVSEAGADPSVSVKWWQALAAHDPYDPRFAIGLVRSLAAFGSITGALRHARIHEQLVREDLGIEPSTEFLALVDGLRAEPRSASPHLRVHQDAERDAPARDRTAPLPPESKPAPQLGRRIAEEWRRALGLGAVSAVLLGALLTLRTATTPAADVTSIAVLPLTHRLKQPGDPDLADGMTEELIAELARTGVRVVARTSVFALRSASHDIRTIADSLGVSHVLEGEWLGAGTEPIVRLRLVDGRDGAIVWSEEYRRPTDNVVAAQGDIARSVASALGLTRVASVDAPARRTTESVAAWELYRRASQPEALRSDEAAREALAQLEQAVELDPRFADAHAALARLTLRAGYLVDPEQSPRERLAVAHGHAVRSVELDELSAEGQGVLGLIEMLRFDFESAESRLDLSLSLDPSRSQTREWMIHLRIWQGRHAEALAAAEEALARDPLSATALAELTRALLINDRCDEAWAHLAALADLRPRVLRAGPIAAQCHASAGRWQEALAEVSRPPGPSEGLGLAMVGYFAARSGRVDLAQTVLESLTSDPAEPAFAVATVYLGLGRSDETMAWLERSLNDSSFDRTVMEPMYRELHDDPRFRSLLARVGLTP